MIRLPVLLLAALVATASLVLFRTSYEVQALAERLGALNREIVHEQQAIRVLRAEWAYLNQPARLRELAERHSSLAPAMAGQIIARLDEIPTPLPKTPGTPIYPLPARKPNRVDPGPALVAHAAPATTEKVVLQTAQAAVRAGPAGDAVDLLLANFRRQQNGPEPAQ